MCDRDTACTGDRRGARVGGEVRDRNTARTGDRRGEGGGCVINQS